ncbi:hypothetical protein ACE1TI_20285 [Alteribacillus sp. JSM 102045]|uniref:hypothetical protein n=1 Tax=Alteribacillus sp. JSM 102045 TaxID=1562101 RepID=UPI0035C12ED3
MLKLQKGMAGFFMHVFITALVIFLVWRSGNYKQWRKYHTTMWFFAGANLTYYVLCANYFLWEIHADFSAGYSLQIMLYTFIVYPGSLLLFLANYPGSIQGKIFHNVKWIGIYTGTEYIYYLLGLITFNYGWHLGWSLLFLCIMFPMLRLHHTKPLLTYVLSILITLILLWIFNVPVEIPIEER